MSTILNLLKQIERPWPTAPVRSSFVFYRPLAVRHRRESELQWMPSRRWFRPQTANDNTLTVRNCDATDCTGATVAYLEVCFAPRGQTRFRTANNAAWLPLTQVFGFQVATSEGATNVGNRFVFLSPNGLARLRL